MRRDLHTLFKRDLIVVSTNTWAIHLAPQLRVLPACRDLRPQPADVRWRNHVEPQLLEDRLDEARVDLKADVRRLRFREDAC